MIKKSKKRKFIKEESSFYLKNALNSYVAIYSSIYIYLYVGKLKFFSVLYLISLVVFLLTSFWEIGYTINMSEKEDILNLFSIIIMIITSLINIIGIIINKNNNIIFIILLFLQSILLIIETIKNLFNKCKERYIIGNEFYLVINCINF